MKLLSKYIPQADLLSDVAKTVEAVNNNAHTFQDIAEYLGKVERQGRYYRLAAELLGFITKTEPNHSELTDLGRQYIRDTDEQRRKTILNAVLNTKLFQRITPFLENHPNGITRDDLEFFLEEVTEPVGMSMMQRRASTILHWLNELQLLRQDGNNYFLTPQYIENISLLTFQDVTEPVMPKTSHLKEYVMTSERVTKAARAVQMMRDEAKVERANNAHIRLVNMVAARLRLAGTLPRANPLIDLAAQLRSREYIFEMKSITDGNVRSQIRRGLSQLYEYRYLQNLPQAHLVLVVEKPLPDKFSWMLDYLETDRQVNVVWDGDDELYATPKTQYQLDFLWSG